MYIAQSEYREYGYRKEDYTQATYPMGKHTPKEK
jgi:hypothetical protein